MDLERTDKPNSSLGEPEKHEMKIFLKVMKTVALKVKSSDSIYKIKSKFRAMEGISSNLHPLFFAGNHLADNKTPADYSIPNGSTLNMYVSSGVAMLIFVKTPATGKSITLEVKIWDTVLAIKAKIRDKEGIPLDRQILVYLGRTLDDGQTLVYYDIIKDSTLNMILRPVDEVQISVNMPSNGKTFTLKAKIWYTICDIKTMIESIEHVTPDRQNLVYAGKQLEDSRTLFDYKIGAGSVLRLVVDCSSIQILVKTWSGNTITLEVDGEDTINKVRGKIQTKMGIPTMRYGLVFAGKRLTDDHTLEDYGVHRGSMLDMR